MWLSKRSRRRSASQAGDYPSVASAQNGLAFRLKESIGVRTARLKTASRRTLRPGDRFDPGLDLVRAPEWPGPKANGRVHPMSTKLTNTQLVILSAAAQRDDRCLFAPKSLKGGAAQKVAAKLTAAGLVKEIKAKAGMAIWRRDSEASQDYSLRLTAAGLRAIAVDDGGAEAGAGENAPASVSGDTESIAPAPSEPRDGTKLAQVVGLLQRDQGATLDEVIAATGWLPHTSRAALTGLRKRGYAIERRPKPEGGKGYVIVAASQAQSA